MIVCGFHAVRSCLAYTPDRVLRVSVQRGRRDDQITELIQAARSEQIQVTQIGRDALDRICDGAVHQGIAAHCQAYEPYSETEFETHFQMLDKPFLLAIEGVTDPRNLGACLRSAAGAGVDAVLLPRSRSAPLSSVAFKAASGALSSLYVVRVANLARRLEWLRERGVWVIGTDSGADQNYTEADYRAATVIVLGSEDKGLRKLTKDLCDSLVSIPMTSKVESLNVSVATGVVLYECVRQRLGS